jgi:fluoroquinolone resistance protein
MTLFTEQIFDGLDFTTEPLQKADYEQCRFLNCNFSDLHLSGFGFEDCEFENCNLSMAKVRNTSLKTVSFRKCKLVGLNFGEANPFLITLHFEDCSLNLASFYKLKLKNTTFKNCNLQEVDFTETDLTASLLDNCDLSNATFDRSILEKSDFRTAVNYRIDPDNNRLKKAKFSASGVVGLLVKYDILIS